MLPLIRQPHWTTWTASFSSSLPVEVGTRDYNGKGHLLIVNTSGTPVTATFTLAGLPYTPTSVTNYFSGTTITSVSGNSFTMTIPALGVNSGTAVVRIEGTGGPSATLTATPTTVTTCGQTTLTWSSTGTTGCTGTNFSTGGAANNATGVQVTPTAPSTTYRIDCPGTAGGTATASQTVSVQGPPGPCTSLLLHWPLDDGLAHGQGHGSTVVDTSGNNYTGTAINGAGVSGQGGPLWVTGKVGPYALSFTGTNSEEVYSSQMPWTSGNPLTIELWVRAMAQGTQAGLVDVTSGYGGLFGCDLPLADNATLRCYYGTTSLDAPFTGLFNAWTHLAYVATTTQRLIYLDGVNVASQLTSVTPPSTSLTNFVIGNMSHGANGTLGTFYTGAIDDVYVWSCARSAADIRADAVTSKIRHRAVHSQ